MSNLSSLHCRQAWPSLAPSALMKLLAGLATLPLACMAQIAAPEGPASDEAAPLVNFNSHMIGATVSAAQRNSQRRMLQQLQQSGIAPQQYEITISNETLRRLRTSGVAADFNICSLVARSDQPGTANVQRGVRSSINCSVNGLSN